MKKTFPIILGLSFALIMFSCKTQTKEIIKQNDKTIKTVVQKKTLLVEKSLSQVVPEKNYTIDTAYIKNDTIIMTISYIGGCGEHNFDLIWNGSIIKTLPVKAPIYLRHISENETCKNKLIASLFFDISELRNTSKKKVFILLDTYKKNSLILE